MPHNHTSNGTETSAGASTAPDWADERAAEIAACRGIPDPQLRRLIAMSLRLAREEGISAGLTKAEYAIFGGVAS